MKHIDINVELLEVKRTPAARSSISYLFLFILPRFALRFIRPDPRGRVTDPVGDVVSFMHSFEEKYGRSHPVFYQGTYSQVSSDFHALKSVAAVVFMCLIAFVYPETHRP